MIDPAGTLDTTERLDGVRVLIVEDEYLIADDLRRELTSAGAEIVGPAPTLALAHDELDRGAFDLAVLDLNLNGESAVPIAQRLVESQIPFVIATGYGSPSVPAELLCFPRVEKPFDPPAVVRALVELRPTAE